MNGVPLDEHARRGTVFVQPDGPGFLRLTVMDAGGRSDSVMVRVQ
jgi:penicillin-binding protein 1C